MAQAPLKTFADRAVKRHCRAAITLLRARDRALTVLDPDTYDVAAGHLKAVQKATGLTPPQICDALRIHGWRRRHMLPQSGGGFRFRMGQAAVDAMHTTAGRVRHHRAGRVATDAQLAAKPTSRTKLFRPRDAQTSQAIDDPLAP